MVTSITTKLAIEIVVRRGAAAQVIEGVAQNFDEQEHQEHGEGGGGDGFVLPVSVGMILVRRLTGGADAHQADDVRRAVGERMEAVGEDADGAARVPERDLGDRDDQVEEEHSDKDEGDFARDAKGLGTGGWGLGAWDWRSGQRARNVFLVPSP